MQQFFSFLSWCLFTVQHVSGVLPPIIRNTVTAVAASGFTFVSWWQSCCVRGQAARPARPRTQHDCHYDMKVKPEAATAVIALLMMGGKTSETCWAVNILYQVGDLFELNVKLPFQKLRRRKDDNFVNSVVSCTETRLDHLWILPYIPYFVLKYNAQNDVRGSLTVWSRWLFTQIRV
jgi:hypothetical protein